MKHFSTALLVLLVHFLFSACKQPQPENPSGNAVSQGSRDTLNAEMPPIATDSAVSILLPQKKFEASELEENITLIMTNNSNKEVMTGEHYYIEKQEERLWNTLPSNMFFDDIGYLLQPGQSRTFEVSLLVSDYNYTPGEYRIKKGYSVLVKEHEYNDYDIYAEFTLK